MSQNVGRAYLERHAQKKKRMMQLIEHEEGKGNYRRADILRSLQKASDNYLEHLINSGILEIEKRT